MYTQSLLKQIPKNNKLIISKVARLVVLCKQKQTINKLASIDKKDVSLTKQVALLVKRYNGDLSGMQNHIKSMKSLRGAKNFRQLYNSPLSMKLRSIMANNKGGAGNVSRQLRLDQLLSGAKKGKGSRTALKDLEFNKIKDNNIISGISNLYNTGYKEAQKAKSYLSDFLLKMKLKGLSLNANMLGVNANPLFYSKNKIKLLAKNTANTARVEANKDISNLLPV